MASRTKTEYEDFSNKFLLTSFDYHKQYSHFYAHRLKEMSVLLRKRIQSHWGSNYEVKKLCDLREEQNEACIIIGTIYKHQVHKPSILREISEENQLAPQPVREHYADLEDKLILEDELQRVRLYGKVDGRYMASGVVCAALGCIEDDGRFDVEEMLFYEAGLQKPLAQFGNSRKVVFISGIDYSQIHNYADALNLFQHWLCGNILGNSKTEGIIRLIVAGNSVRATAEDKKLTPLLSSRNKDNNTETIEAIRSLDNWFSFWSKTVFIDLMPGAHDPANFMLPQQPFHQFMFPEASKCSSFRSVANPYACAVDNCYIVGCSGQNIHDLLRCTMIEEPLEALRITLLWGHIAPSAPDTLACYPYVQNDPFILHECPHVYFAGNCDSLQTDLHRGTSEQQTRLVCIPSFYKTRSVAVVDLETLDCNEVKFDSE